MSSFGHFRPGRHQRVCRREISQNTALFPVADQRPDDKQHTPERRQQIAHRAVKQVKPAHRVQAFGMQQTQMLQIALTPAAIPLDVVGQCGGGFFIGSPNAGQKPHAPAGTAQERGFDKIMAHDQAFTARPPTQTWQARAGGKGPRAQNGVVAPVVALLPRPLRHAFGKRHAIDAVGELLRSGEYGMCTNQMRIALDQTGRGIARKGIGQSGNRLACHQTVCIQHQHGRIVRAPVAHPVGDVADFAFRVLRAPSVKERQAG